MTVRQDTFPFPSAPDTNLTVSDSLLNATTPLESIWSTGQTVVSTAPTPQQINQAITLQSVGISAQMALSAANEGAFYGKLGKVLGGLLLPTAPQNTDPFAARVAGMLPLPNPSLSFDLWDPTSDPMPRTFLGQYSPPTGPELQDGLWISGQLQLPTPLELVPGENITLGIWMLPSLIGSLTAPNFNTWNWEMDIYNASYTLTYDDGRG